MLRKKLLLIALFIVGCEEPSQHGCLDSQACNYDADATLDNNSCLENDCDGVCGGSAVLDVCGVCDSDATNDGATDNCGVCDNDATNDCTADCAGEWGGIQFIDCSGQCGILIVDECGECGGNNAICTDCNGVVNGEAEFDKCGDCVGGDTGLEACTYDCLGVWGGATVEDCKGECLDGSAEDGSISGNISFNGNWNDGNVLISLNGQCCPISSTPIASYTLTADQLINNQINYEFENVSFNEYYIAVIKLTTNWETIGSYPQSVIVNTQNPNYCNLNFEVNF